MLWFNILFTHSLNFWNLFNLWNRVEVFKPDRNFQTSLFITYLERENIFLLSFILFTYSYWVPPDSF